MGIKVCYVGITGRSVWTSVRHLPHLVLVPEAEAAPGYPRAPVHQVSSGAAAVGLELTEHISQSLEMAIRAAPQVFVNLRAYQGTPSRF